jgi:hypothetical protein
MGHLQDDSCRRQQMRPASVTRAVVCVKHRADASAVADKQVFSSQPPVYDLKVFFLLMFISPLPSLVPSTPAITEELCQQFGIGNTGADHHPDRARIESAVPPSLQCEVSRGSNVG